MTSLTPRQTLGVFLQGRAAYWQKAGKQDEAEKDLLLAVRCFTQNREVRMQLVQAMSAASPRYFASAELASLGTELGGPSVVARSRPRNPSPLGYMTPAEIDRMNRQNALPDPLLSQNP